MTVGPVKETDHIIDMTISSYQELRNRLQSIILSACWLQKKISSMDPIGSWFAAWDFLRSHRILAEKSSSSAIVPSLLTWCLVSALLLHLFSHSHSFKQFYDWPSILVQGIWWIFTVFSLLEELLSLHGLLLFWSVSYCTAPEKQCLIH